MSEEHSLWEQHEEQLRTIYQRKGARVAWLYWRRHHLSAYVDTTWRAWLTGSLAQLPGMVGIADAGDLLEHLLDLHEDDLHWLRWVIWARRGGIRTWGISFADCVAEEVAIEQLGIRDDGSPLKRVDLRLVDPPASLQDLMDQLGEEFGDG